MQELQKVSVSRILEAQNTVIRESKPFAGGVMPTFMYTATEEFLAGSALTDAIRQGAARIHALIGNTLEEFNAFHDLNQTLSDMTEEDVPSVAEKLFGDDWRSLVDYARSVRPGAIATQAVTDAQTESFVRPIRELAQAVARGTGKSWCFRLDWSAPKSEYGACHCLDLPFVFGTFEAFKNAPMLAGGDQKVMRALSLVLRSAIGRFVKHGSPTELPDWQPFVDARPVTMVFNGLLHLSWWNGGST